MRRKKRHTGIYVMVDYGDGDIERTNRLNGAPMPKWYTAKLWRTRVKPTMPTAFSAKLRRVILGALFAKRLKYSSRR